MSSARRRAVVLTVVAGLLLLSACSRQATPSGEETPPPPPATETTAPATTAPDPTAQTPTAPAPVPTPAAPSVAPSPTGPAGGGGQPDAPATGVDAARAWVDALAAGDRDAAYAVLGEASREQIGGREGLESLASALSEGWAAFGRAEARYVATPVDAGSGEAGVVTVIATVTQEGTTERRALTMPYRVEAGRATVDPFVASDAPAAIDEPQPGTTIGCDAAITVSVPAARSAVALSLDGQVLPAPNAIPTDSEVEALTADLPGGLAQGEHVLTVAFVDADGRIGGTAALFTLAQACA